MPSTPNDNTADGFSSRGPSIESELIDLFIRLAASFGFPRSMGEIYGLLFSAQERLSFDDITQRLGLSVGSVSHGLRSLRGLGAITLVYESGDRRDYFLAEVELKTLAAGLVRERLEPFIMGGRERLERMDNLVKQMPNCRARRHFAERLQLLNAWQKSIMGVIPRLRAMEVAQETEATE